MSADVTPSPEPAPAPKRAPGLAFILAVVFLDIAGIGLAIPVVPALVATFVGGDLSQASVHVGTMSALYTGMMFLFAPFLGALSDAYGRKPVLLGALAISTLSFFGAAFAPTLGVLLAVRALGGIGGASLSVAQTYIADVSTPEDRAKNFGLIGAAFGMGFIVGPAIGGWLGHFAPHYPFVAAGAVALLNLLYGVFFMVEPHKPENRRAFRWSEANPLGWIVVLRRHAGVRRLSYALVWVWFGQQAMYNTWVLFTSHQHHWGPAENGLSLAVVGISSAVVQGMLTGRILSTLGERVTIVGGLLWSAVAFLGYAAAPQGWMLYPMIFFACFASVSGPALQGLVSRQVGPDEQGVVQGAMTSLTAITGVAGPLVANNLFAYATAPGTSLPLPGIGFYLGAFGLTLGAIIAAGQVGGKQLAAAPAPEAALEPAGDPA